jgi:hypothetical protein
MFITSLVYAILNWRVLDMVSAGASGTVMVDDQRLYIRIETLRGNNPTEIHIAFCEVCDEQTVDRSSLPLGYSFWWWTYHHKRWPKGRKAKNINRWTKCEIYGSLSCRRSLSRVRGNITRYRDFTNINILYFDKQFAEKKKLCPMGPSLLDYWTET